MALRCDVLDALIDTLDDLRLTRSEKKGLRAVLADAPLTADERGAVVAEVFAAVHDRMHDPRDRELLTWLRGALGALEVQAREPADPRSRCWFGPEDAMVEALLRLLGDTRATADIAVFTITDDRVTDALLAMHRRGLQLRVLSDDDKAHDRGSDAHRLRDAGVPVVFDRSPHHFHHKFAVLDAERLINGSYNWTRSADLHNRENFLVTSDPSLVQAYGAAFDRMWDQLA